MRLKLSSVKSIAIFSGSIALAAAIVLQTGTVHAQTTNDTWKDGMTGNWSIGTNWTSGLVPTSGTTTVLTFGNTTTTGYTSTNDIANPFVLNSLTLNNTGTGLITLGSANQIQFDGTSPTLNFNGTGNAVVSNPLLFNTTSVIGGSGTGTLTLSGAITNNTAQATNLSVNNTGGGVVNFTGVVALSPAAATSINNTGGSFFATNGVVNTNSAFTANNLFYVGDSITSITNFNNGAGTTGTNANATLNVTGGNLIENGRFSIGAFSGDKGTVTVAVNTSLSVNPALDSNSAMSNYNANFFSSRLQLGGYGGGFNSSNGQVDGIANGTPGAANLILNGGEVDVASTIEVYTNGNITANSDPVSGKRSIIHTAAVANGNASTSGIGGISLTNSDLYLDGPNKVDATITYSGIISGTGGAVYKDDIYTQVLAGNNTLSGTLNANGGTLIINGNTTTNIIVRGNNVSNTKNGIQTGTLNVSPKLDAMNNPMAGTGIASGNINIAGGRVSGTGTLGAISLANSTFTDGTVSVGTISPGGTGSALSGTGSGVGVPGTLNGQSLTWFSAAAMNFDLNLASRSTGNDLLNLSSFFRSGDTNPVVGGYTFNFTTTGTFSGTQTTYDLVDFQNGSTPATQNNFIASDFTANGIPAGLMGVFSFNGANNILQFTVSAAMPEPSALPFALAGLGPVGFVAFRRARRRAA